MKQSGNNKLSIILVFVLFLFIGNSIVIAQQENLNVLDRWIEWSDSENMLIHHLNKQAFGYLDLRDREIAELKTKVDWLKRQRKVKEILMDIVGPFPEKTPLNPRVTGVVRKNGFRIEKIIYESMPNLYVTAGLFIPDGITGKRPVIIQVSGHGFQAFRSRNNQKMIYNLVNKGFIVFAIDPLGQGERIQYWDDEKKGSMMGSSPTSEHSYFGNQMFMSGVSPGKYFIWDGIRGIDYLLTRSEVDSKRIGIFGCSGGGTQVTYISAFDDRIKAAVPGCFITGFRRLMESIGAQDAEQNFYHGVSNGITHADFLELRAPKPLLISSTTRDFFSIQGAMETFKEVKRAYKAFGKEENIGHVTDDAGHGFHGTAEEIYAFFQKALELPGSPVGKDYEILKSEELNITTTGQLSTLLGGETAFSINKKETQKLINKIEESRKSINVHLDKVKMKAKELSGYASPSEKVKSVFRGRYQRDGYSVEMYVLQGEGEYVIPLLLFVPNGEGKFPAILYLHPEGKSAEASVSGEIEKLVKKGFIVAAPDLVGTGEVGTNNMYSSRYAAVLIGRSIPGIQAGDATQVVNFLKSR
ncbi:MAG TPA: xylan esterase, partial [bacterium]|nr:xylan esterase [bacterium]